MFTRALGTTTTGFEGQFRFLADTQGLGTAAGRHPSADLLPVFNAAYKALVQLVTAKGYTQFVSRGTTTALPTTPFEAGETFSTIALGTAGTPGTPPTQETIKRIDVRISGSDWYVLPEVTFLQLRDLTPSRYFGSPTKPKGWCWLNVGAVTAANYSTAGAIAIAPVPTSGSFCLWTLNAIADVVNPTDVFLYHTEDWAQWQMYRAMLAIAGVRDKNSAGKIEAIQWFLNEENPGSPAWNIAHQAPTASGPRTWTRGNDYRGVGPWR
jgi:hypothetical protein